MSKIKKLIPHIKNSIVLFGLIAIYFMSLFLFLIKGSVLFLFIPIVTSFIYIKFFTKKKFNLLQYIISLIIFLLFSLLIVFLYKPIGFILTAILFFSLPIIPTLFQLISSQEFTIKKLSKPFLQNIIVNLPLLFFPMHWILIAYYCLGFIYINSKFFNKDAIKNLSQTLIIASCLIITSGLLITSNCAKSVIFEEENILCKPLYKLQIIDEPTWDEINGRIETYESENKLKYKFHLYRTIKQTNIFDLITNISGILLFLSIVFALEFISYNDIKKRFNPTFTFFSVMILILYIQSIFIIYKVALIDNISNSQEKAWSFFFSYLYIIPYLITFIILGSLLLYKHFEKVFPRNKT